jgi:hypothetical protein
MRDLSRTSESVQDVAILGGQSNQFEYVERGSQEMRGC